MRRSIVPLSIVLVLSLVILACNLPFITIATQDTGQVAISVAQTVAALNAQQQTVPTLAPQIPTLAPAPTQIIPSIPTLVLPPTATPLPCNRALPVSETYVDGTNFNINTNFNKSWRIRNGGTCTWNANYTIAFLSGAGMSGPASKHFSGYVAPGETIDLILPLKAPGTAGSYRGYWGLYGDDNVYFGKVWVDINAVNPVGPFAVTSVSSTVNNAAPAACPLPFVFTSAIHTNGAGTVTYHWIRSDSAINAPQTLTFGAAGTQSVSYTWSLGASGTFWVQLYIDSPNHQGFSQVSVTCP